MAKTWNAAANRSKPARPPRDWPRRMSDNIAWALLVYTALQIFVTMQAIKGKGGSLLPYLALVVLVGAIIPACRAFERRWEDLPPGAENDPALRPRFNRDRLGLWLIAIGLPFALTALFKGVGALL